MPTAKPEGVVEPPGQWSNPSSRSGANPVPGSPSGNPGRFASGARILSDERLQWVEILLDEVFVIPGTRIRFGLDGLIGLIPGLGDVLAAILSLFIPLAAWIRGVPYITVIRMLTNVSIGLLVGTIPILGDAFDIFWKANRRNYLLLTRSIAEPHRHTWRDWAFLLLLGFAITIIFAIPIALIVWLLAKLSTWPALH